MLKRTALGLLGSVGYVNAAGPIEPNSNDPSSYSNTLDITTTHFHLDLNVDLDKKQLIGSNTLSLNVLKRTTQLVLDIMDINVTKAYLMNKDKTKTELNHLILTPNKNLG